MLRSSCSSSTAGREHPLNIVVHAKPGIGTGTVRVVGSSLLATKRVAGCEWGMQSAECQSRRITGPLPTDGGTAEGRGRV
jgi:hypothetical protein